MPAQCFVLFHKRSIVSVMIPSISNSPTTRDTGLVVYTTTTATGCRKMALRNSKRLSPRKMASAYLGLIDNNAWICLGEGQDCREVILCDLLETAWYGLDVADDAIVDQLL
jgi:hypothetical protein